MTRDSLLWWLLPLCVALAGCPEPPVPVTSSTSQTTSIAEEPTAASSQDQCAGLMVSLQQIFELQALDISSNIDDGLQDLNRWLTDCAEPGSLKDPVPASLTSLATSEMRDTLTGPRFTPADGEHLRTCLVLNAQSRYAAGKAESSRDQAEAVFEYLMRTIALVDDDLPRTPSEVCLTGRGTALDRAWIFAGLLRQMRIDAVWLTAPDAEAQTPGLVAVLIKGQEQPEFYLFDALRGVAVRTDVAHSAPLATLAQVLEKPDLLPGWTAESLKQARVGLIGSLSTYSPRMAQLQPHFSGDRTMVISDPLADTEQGPGYAARVLAGSQGLWTAESLQFWTHEDSVLERRKSLGQEQADQLATSLETLQAPLKPQVSQDGSVVVDPTTNQARFDAPDREFWKARLLQLDGQYEVAIAKFTLVRNAHSNLKEKAHWPVEPRLRTLHQRASEDAQFFVGLCQYQQGDFAEAVPAFKKTAALPESPWKAAALRNLALCQAALGEKEQAVVTLKKLPENDPQAAWAQSRIAGWQGQAP